MKILHKIPNSAFHTSKLSLAKPSREVEAAKVHPEVYETPESIRQEEANAAKDGPMQPPPNLFFKTDPRSMMPELMGPVPEGGPWPAHIEELTDKFMKLSIVEMIWFMQCVSKRLNIPWEVLMNSVNQYSSAPGPAAPPPHAAQQQQQQAPADQAKKDAGAAAADKKVDEKAKQALGFKVTMTAIAEGAKYKVLKEIRVFKPTLTIPESKKFVDTLPSDLVLGVDEATAKQWKEKLEAVGATIVIE